MKPRLGDSIEDGALLLGGATLPSFGSFSSSFGAGGAMLSSRPAGGASSPLGPLPGGGGGGGWSGPMPGIGPGVPPTNRRPV